MRPIPSPSSGVNRAGKQNINNNNITNKYDISTNRQNTLQDNKTHFVIKRNTQTPRKKKKKKKKTKRKRRTLRKYKRRETKQKKKKACQTITGNRRIGRYFAIKRQKTKNGTIHTARRPSRRLKNLILSQKKCKNRHNNLILIFPLLSSSKY